jgi:tetratricopeptide (TPR) repeat protein
MEMHFVIAKTISYTDPGNGVAIAEYQKAIKMAQEQGSDDVLKEFYLEQIMAYVDFRLISADEHALEAIENYLKLDDSNAKVLAGLGVVRLENYDYKGAVEHFQKSLELNKRDHEVGVALLLTLFRMNNFDGMMSQIEHYGVPTVGSWLRESDSLDDHKAIMHAARIVNKVDMVIKCYEHEIQNTQLSDEDLKEVKDADPVKTAQQTLLNRTRRVANSSMFRVYLGWLYLEILGQPDEAFELWKTAFFQRSEFFNMGNVISSQFTTEVIPDFFARFSQLIYEKALDPDPEVAGRMIFHLEHLHRREKVFQELDKHPIGTGLRNVNLLLARLYLKHGRKEEARKMLNDQFQSAINILEDEIGWNDEFGYGALAALLFLNGQLEKAEVASSLKRFFEDGFDVESKKRKDDAERKDGKGEGQQPPPDKQDDSASTASDNNDDGIWLQTVCAGGFTCESESRGIPYGATAYTCTTCANVSFCETCYDILRKETGKRNLFVCSPSHEFIKTPPEGLEKIKDQKITMNGKSISFVDWLAEVRKEWKTGLCFKS